jgi:A/G-specific adenine glycosylase
MKRFLLLTEMFSGFVRYFDERLILLRLPPKGIRFGFRSHAKDNPAIFNQAIMEFGALQCVPKTRLQYLYFNESCRFAKNKVDQLPVKSKKLKVRNRYFNYLVLETGNTIVQKRTDKGIWHNLYEFPLIETEKEEDFDAVTVHLQTNFRIIIKLRVC